MELKFNEKKAIQIVAILLKRNGGTMDLLRLTKLLYLVDREALVRWGRSLTGDRYASMQRGMVLSETYDLSKRKFTEPRLWDNYISAPNREHEMSLLKSLDFDELSKADIELIYEIYEKFEEVNTSYLIERVHHRLPEWVDVGKSSLTINYETVLEKSGVENLESVLDNIESHSYFEQFTLQIPEHKTV
jgi:uncharacterized phage-associated protein